MLRKFVVALPIVMLAAGSTACASKKFVRTSVGEVNDKVDSMGRSLEETQERTRKNEGRIGEVDQKAQQAQSAADQANSAAGQARQEATNARNEANTKFETIDKTSKRLVYEVVLSEDSGNFKFGKTLLPDEAKSKLDQMVAQLKQDPKNVFIEIEGHTDNVGDKVYNEKLGEERAEQVKRYLYEAHQIPLHKINVISYGEDKPVSPNNSKAGRAQNRRVVIRILS